MFPPSRIAQLYPAVKKIARNSVRRILDRRLPVSIAPPRRLLMVRWDGKLGDALVSSFFIRETLRLDSLSVTVVTTPALAEFYRSVYGSCNILVTEENPGLFKMLQLWSKLPAIDTVVHLVGRIRLRELFLLRLLAPRNVFSLDDDLAWVNGKLRDATAGYSFGTKYARVLQQLGLEHPDMSPEPLQKGCSIPENGATRILFNPFGSRLDKSIREEKAVTLLMLLADRFPDTVIEIMHQERTRKQAESMWRHVGRTNVVLAPRAATLAGLIEFVASANIVISVDTGVVHLADTMRRKLVAIYPVPIHPPNPWLPRPTHLTRVVYSARGQPSETSSETKNMNNFDEYEVLWHAAELAVERPARRDLSLRARFVPGLGVASRNLVLQLPLLGVHAPEIAHCHPGTLNIMCERAFTVTAPDVTTPELAWVPGSKRLEAFSLLRVELSVSSHVDRIPAWIYIAHNSPHRQTPAVHEVLAPHLLLDRAAGLTVHLDSAQIELL